MTGTGLTREPESSEAHRDAQMVDEIQHSAPWRTLHLSQVCRRKAAAESVYLIKGPRCPLVAKENPQPRGEARRKGGRGGGGGKAHTYQSPRGPHQNRKGGGKPRGKEGRRQEGGGGREGGGEGGEAGPKKQGGEKAGALITAWRSIQQRCSYATVLHIGTCLDSRTLMHCISPAAGACKK